LKQSKTSIISRIFGHFFLLANIGAIIWLAICAYGAYVNPINMRHVALFTVTTPLAIIANIFFVFFWLFTKRKLRFLLSLITLAACYKIIMMIFGFNYFGQNDMQKAPGRIRIVTWNAHGMGVFNVPHSKSFDNRLIDFIQETNADILCLPEYHVPKTDVMKPFARKIIANNQYMDFRFKDDNTLGTTIFLGTAVFSKYTFKNYVAHRLAEYTYLLQGDVDLPGGQTVRMFFVHLSTFGFSDDDKAYIEYVKKHSSFMGKGLGYSRSFLWKFNYAFARRASEVDKAASIIAQSPYPIVLCGDFNDLPGSYTYTKLRGNLSDAFLEKGKGFGRTYNEIFPTLRIDHMFYDPKALKPVGYSCSRTSLSDHNPVMVNFEIIPKAAN